MKNRILTLYLVVISFLFAGHVSCWDDTLLEPEYVMRIVAITPSHAVPGDTITITGEGFGDQFYPYSTWDATSVWTFIAYISGSSTIPSGDADIISWSNTQIVANVRTGIPSGDCVIKVRRNGEKYTMNGYSESNAFPFRLD